MPELVKQRRHFLEAHERRLPLDRGHLVADQIRDRKSNRLTGRSEQLAASHALVHPGAAALLLRPAIGIQIEAGDLLALV